MDLALAGKTVWITGASGGIGRALTRAFAEEGARLGLSGHRSLAALEAWTAEQPWREHALVLGGDARDATAMERAADALATRFGRIDVLVANAGRWPVPDRPLHELEPERLRETLDVNLLGPLFTARAFLRVLARTGPRGDGQGAAIVFTGSTAGHFGERGHGDYAAAKAGLVGAMHTLKNEVVRIDPFARVNVVEPGWTVTEFPRDSLGDARVVERVTRTMALRQLGRAVDVARTVLWLASPHAAGHVSGQVVRVDGGMEGRLLWEQDEVRHGAILGRLERD